MNKMSRIFRYDIVTLLEAVESYPCVWDKTSDQFKDKIVRRSAWQDICRIFEPEFDTFDNECQEEIITNIMTKWTHVRDAYKRSLKTKYGQSAKRKYVYAESMQFLHKNATCETEYSSPSIKDEDSDSEEQHDDAPILPKKTPKRVKMNPVTKEMLNARRSKSPRRSEQEIDEDHAFLLSLLPTLKKISEDDKMDFRIEVMQLVGKYSKRIKH